MVVEKVRDRRRKSEAVIGLGLLLPNSVSEVSFGQGVLAIAVFGLERDEVHQPAVTRGPFLPHRLSPETPNDEL